MFKAHRLFVSLNSGLESDNQEGRRLLLRAATLSTVGREGRMEREGEGERERGREGERERGREGKGEREPDVPTRASFKGLKIRASWSHSNGPTRRRRWSRSARA